MTSPLISPVWLEQSRLPALPDEHTLNWLFDQGSLTLRLTALSENNFSVLPLFEGWQTLREDECAALDLPGARKAQIGRLVQVKEGTYRDLIPIYGEPQLLMSVTRSADMNRTPDIRSRCIIPNWAAQITISFVLPTLRETAVVNLLAAAGITAGVGD